MLLLAVRPPVGFREKAAKNPAEELFRCCPARDFSNLPSLAALNEIPAVEK